jgi:hypothetical protein
MHSTYRRNDMQLEVKLFYEDTGRVDFKMYEYVIR